MLMDCGEKDLDWEFMDNQRTFGGKQCITCQVYPMWVQSPPHSEGRLARVSGELIRKASSCPIPPTTWRPALQPMGGWMRGASQHWGLPALGRVGRRCFGAREKMLL